ncbi:MAG: hypothetical protein DYH08_00545 [Actinobacteria bacterium ATB1]|nr:hypothetical protein [Actinobacteria bacterium ATB1]
MTATGSLTRSAAARAVTLAEEIRRLAGRTLRWIRVAVAVSAVVGVVAAIAVWEIFAWWWPVLGVALVAFLAPAAVLWWYQGTLASLTELPDALSARWTDFGEYRAARSGLGQQSRSGTVLHVRPVVVRILKDIFSLRGVLAEVAVNARSLVTPIPHVAGALAALAALATTILVPVVVGIALAL